MFVEIDQATVEVKLLNNLPDPKGEFLGIY